MPPIVLAGPAASARIAAACAIVADRLSYLRAFVGGVDPRAASGTERHEWIGCADVVCDPGRAHGIVTATGRELGTADPVVAASLFVLNYAYRIVAMPIACAVLAGVVPESSADAMRFTIAHGRPVLVDFAHPAGRAFADTPDGVAGALGDDITRDEVLDYLVHTAIDAHLALLIDVVRASTHVGERLLWGNVAAAIAVSFTTVEGLVGSWVRPLAERCLERAPTPMRGSGSFLALEHGGRSGWCWERTSCCLHDRLPSAIRCADCSFTPTSVRRHAFCEATAPS